MKLKTSFFKPVTLKKDILRFAPVWALYFIGMMLIMLEFGSSAYDRFARNFMPECIMAFGVVNICYAAFNANLLFGDLYNTKLCYSLHAMPYRRESWLMTHLLAGLLFSIVPNCLASLYLMFRLEAYWILGLWWLLAVTLQYLFFFGIATVSALLAGNRFPMLVIYAVFNFVAMLIYATVEVIYLPMLEGVVANFADFSIFSPVVQLFTKEYFTFTRIETNYGDIYGSTRIFYQYDGLANGWGYMAILGSLGLAAMAFSCWLYRKRHLESAGDFIAFPKLKGIVCVVLTLCVALCFAVVGELTEMLVLWLAVGLFIGFFGSLMLLERRLKVFRKDTWLRFAAVGFAVVLSLLAVYLDWFGIESWTPNASQVQSITVSDSRNPEYSSLRATLEEEYDIQQIITAHEDILTCLDGSKDYYESYDYVYLSYKLKSGRTVSRYYQIPKSGAAYQIFRGYLYNTESVLGFKDAAVAAQQITYMYSAKGHQIPPSMYEKVLRALQIDHANGHVELYYGGEYYIEYNLRDSQGNVIYRGISVDKYAGEIPKLLNGPEISMGYSDWSDLLKTIENMVFDDREYGAEIPKADWEGLLTAIRKDIEAGTLQSNEYVDDAYMVYYEMRHATGEYDYREFYVTAKAEKTMAWLVEHEYIPKEEPHQ